MSPSATFGAICSLIGLGVGSFIALTGTGSGYGYFWVYSGLAAFLCGSFFWWLLLERPRRFGAWRGAFAGALAGAVAHYVCWLLNGWSAWACGQALASCAEYRNVMNPIQAIQGAAAFSLLSLLFFGWLTVPGGALLGAGYAKVRAAQERKAKASSA